MAVVCRAVPMALPKLFEEPHRRIDENLNCTDPTIHLIEKIDVLLKKIEGPTQPVFFNANRPQPIIPVVDVPCRNGGQCRYHQRGRCWFRHPVPRYTNYDHTTFATASSLASTHPVCTPSQGSIQTQTEELLRKSSCIQTEDFPSAIQTVPVATVDAETQHPSPPLLLKDKSCGAHRPHMPVASCQVCPSSVERGTNPLSSVPSSVSTQTSIYASTSHVQTDVIDLPRGFDAASQCPALPTTSTDTQTDFYSSTFFVDASDATSQTSSPLIRDTGAQTSNPSIKDAVSNTLPCSPRFYPSAVRVESAQEKSLEDAMLELAVFTASRSRGHVPPPRGPLEWALLILYLVLWSGGTYGGTWRTFTHEGRPFYWNAMIGVSTWDKPEELIETSFLFSPASGRNAGTQTVSGHHVGAQTELTCPSRPEARCVDHGRLRSRLNMETAPSGGFRCRWTAKCRDLDEDRPDILSFGSEYGDTTPFNRYGY